MDYLFSDIGYRYAKDAVITGTSRFDTRIDWILLPPNSHSKKMQSSAVPSAIDDNEACREMLHGYTLEFETGGYEVVDTTDVTDHNMVISSIIVSLDKSNMHVTSSGQCT